jgi:hypothetical protein
MQDSVSGRWSVSKSIFRHRLFVRLNLYKLRHAMVGRNHWRSWSRLLLAAAGLTVSGCWGSGDDAPRESVSGTVTLDGKPLAAGAIQFFPAATSASGFTFGGGDSIKNGKFSISREVGLVPGTYRVSIYSGNAKAERPKAVAPGRFAQVAKEIIPFKYNAQSTLTADVPKGGLSDLRFDLQSK